MKTSEQKDELEAFSSSCLEVTFGAMTIWSVCGFVGKTNNNKMQKVTILLILSLPPLFLEETFTLQPCHL